MQKYETLLFDLDGTLLDFRLAETNALENLREAMDNPLPPEEFRKIYHKVNDAIWLELEQGFITGKELKTERFRRFSRDLPSSRDPEELSEMYLHYLGKESHFYPGAVSLITELAEAGYAMGVITNGLSGVQKNRLDRREFQLNFTSFTISEDVGYAKPSREIFEIVSENMGVPLSEKVLIIGDSLTSDIAGGIQAGISTCWYNPGKWENQSPWKPDMEVSDFGELKEALLSWNRNCRDRM